MKTIKRFYIKKIKLLTINKEGDLVQVVDSYGQTAREFEYKNHIMVFYGNKYMSAKVDVLGQNTKMEYDDDGLLIEWYESNVLKS